VTYLGGNAAKQLLAQAPVAPSTLVIKPALPKQGNPAAFLEGGFATTKSRDMSGVCNYFSHFSELKDIYFFFPLQSFQT